MAGYGDNDPRPVVECEIDELMEWGITKMREIYPRCTAKSVRPMLVRACRDKKMRFLRTENAAALFLVETTPWEPEPYSYQVLIVTRIVAPHEFMRLILEQWRSGRGTLARSVLNTVAFRGRIGMQSQDRL